MRLFRNMPTAVKLGTGFGVCILLAGILGVVSMRQLANMNRVARELAEHYVVQAVRWSEVEVNLQQFRSRERRYMLAVNNQQERQTAEEALEETKRTLQEAIQQFESSSKEQDIRQALAGIKTAWSEYLNLHENLMQLSRAGKVDEARGLLQGEMHRYMRDEIEPLAKQIDQHIGEQSLNLSSLVSSSYTRARNTV